ncbi:MAG: GIY-YIG nuclease family protein [Candidatus Babeliales bacterium]
MAHFKKPDLPSLPGVYLFKNTQHEIIYVGKAKSLKDRVASYFHKHGTDWKIDGLLSEFETIEHVVTHTEHEALLLEAQLIQEHMPKYNVLLKSGQPFVWVVFTNDPVPQVELVRAKKRKGTYFGPFMHKKQARGAMEYIRHTFKLLWCSKKIPGGCLYYHLDLCVGSCKEDFDTNAYLFRVNLAINLLKGRYKESIKELNEKIKEYTHNLEYEKARNLHGYLQNLEVIFNTLKTRFTETKYDKEVFLATTPIWRNTKPDPTLAHKVQELLKLDVAPQTIDCFDISHFQSNAMVGSCVRFVNGVPDKNSFRRFKIKTLNEQNDYAALQEIVKRRYKDPADMPDLAVIDGGKGQLSAVKMVMPNLRCVALAKREETIYSPGDPVGIKLDINSDVGKLMTALRDYAHHFAISYHRLKRRKDQEIVFDIVSRAKHKK